ncbi:MAG: serine/threonine-protein kinase [Myxococcota bacterium]
MPRCPSEATVLDFVHGALPPRRTLRLQRHLDHCLACGQLGAALQAFQPRPRAGIPVPARVGRYKIRRHLRNETYGPVFSAIGPTGEQSCALKLVSGEHAHHLDPATLNALGDRLRRLDDPRVVPILDAGRSGDDVYIVMPRVGGITLRELLEDERDSWRSTADLFTRLARTLHAVHATGIAHGNLTLDNVLIDARGEVRVADFGFAGHGTLPTHSVPRRRGVRGLDDGPRCLAPEQFGGVQDSRTDQFAFGVLLFEALYACAPYQGKTAGDLLMATVDDGLQLPAHRPGGTAMWELVRRCLSTDPRERWPDMATVADELGGRAHRRFAWLGLLLRGRGRPDYRRA